MSTARPARTRWRQTSRITVVGAVLTLAAGLTAAAASAGPSPSTGTAGEPVPVVELPPAGIGTAPATEPVVNATVTLVTGDRVRLGATADGQQTVDVLPPDDLADNPAATPKFVRFTWSGDTYVIPAEAVPYVGSTLDLQLFNVSYLARAGLDDGNSPTVPITVTQRGARASSLPAVTATGRSSNGTVAAAVRKADADALGHRLATRWRASDTARSAAGIGTLPGIERISLARPQDAPAPRDQVTVAEPGSTAPSLAPQGRTGPRFHTLTIDAIDQDGTPGVALGFIQNVHDPSTAMLLQDLPGDVPASYSVPEGLYSVGLVVLNGPANDFTVETALVLKPEVRITSDRTITLDARDAVPYDVGIDTSATPTPPADSYYQQDMLGYTRYNDAGDGLRLQPAGFDGFILLGLHLIRTPDLGVPMLHATPTAEVTEGFLGFAGYTQIVESKVEPTALPRYYLVFPTEGRVPASLTHRLTEADLATVHSSLYGDATATTAPSMYQLTHTVFLPWSTGSLGVGPRVLPGDRIDYWYSSIPDSTYWQVGFNADGIPHRWSGRLTVAPGQHMHTEWNKWPIVPSPAAPPAQQNVVGSSAKVTGPSTTVCTACRQDGNGRLNIHPFGDSDPTHYATSLAGESSVDFYRDGQLLLTSSTLPSGQLWPQTLFLPMTQEAARYRLEWTHTLPDDTAAANHTTWTFRSSGSDPAATLPDDALCSVDPDRACSFLPLLFLTYDLALNHDSKAPAGSPFEIAFAVGHQQHQAPPTGVTATVSASFDDGATWTAPAPATATGDGRFSTTIQHPQLADTNGFVTLRVHATDGAGNTVDQTLTRAYGLH